MKVSQSFSMTLRGKNQGEYYKIGVELSEIDTSLPIGPQLEEGKDALKEVWEFIYNKIDGEVDKVQTELGLNKGNK